MEPIYLSIEPEKTGKKIKKLLDASGYTVRDVQRLMGFNNPQAIYKWLSGKSLPSIDNFVILSRLLHTSIDNLLVVDEEVVVLYGGTGGVSRYAYFTIFSKSEAGCLQIGQMKSSGISSPTYSYPQMRQRHTVCPSSVFPTACGFGLM